MRLLGGALNGVTGNRHFTSAALPRARGHPGTMGMLLAKMWSSFFGLEEFKILIVGLNNAGKTTTLYKLCAPAL